MRYKWETQVVNLYSGQSRESSLLGPVLLNVRWVGSLPKQVTYTVVMYGLPLGVPARQTGGIKVYANKAGSGDPVPIKTWLKLVELNLIDQKMKVVLINKARKWNAVSIQVFGNVTTFKAINM